MLPLRRTTSDLAESIPRRDATFGNMPNSEARPVDRKPFPEPSWHGADPENPDYLDDPYPYYERMRAEAPVSVTPMGNWRLTRYEDVLRLLRLQGAGMRQTDGKLPGQTEADESDETATFMLLADPPKHTRLRKLVSRAFTPRAIQAWKPRIEAVTSDLLDRVAARGEMDLVADLALPVPSTLICEMLGVPLEDRHSFTEWTADATHGLAVRRATSPPELIARVDNARMALIGYFNNLIEQRRGLDGDDLLDVMIAAEEDGDRLTTPELLVQSIGLLIAGFETTIGLIANGLTTLIQNPEQAAVLRERPQLIESAVEECLRYSGPITWTIRVLHEEAEFGGYVLPANTAVNAGLAAANRDPDFFSDPERFDVARYTADPAPPAHLSFGGGVHFCLGSHLARLETQVAIGALISRFDDLELLEKKTSWGRSLFRVPGRVPIRFRDATG
jgi:cytochrome P450